MSINGHIYKTPRKKKDKPSNPEEIEFFTKTKVIAFDTSKKVLCFADFDKTPINFQIIYFAK